MEEPEELGPVPTSAGNLLTVDALAPRRFERRHLSRGVLIVRGNAGVTFTDNVLDHSWWLNKQVEQGEFRPRPPLNRPLAYDFFRFVR